MADQTFIVSLFPAAVALISARISYRSARMSQRLASEREERTRAQLAEDFMRKYRDPLLRSAFDLQSRLYNILRNDFLGKYYVRGTPAEHEYACYNTLHVLAEYFGWSEILRREIQFLDLRDQHRNRELSARLDAIDETFLSEAMDPTFRVFRGEQRAIGEIVMTRLAPTAPPAAQVSVSSMPSGALPAGTTPIASLSATARPVGRETIGYATFVANLTSDETFARWFNKLKADVDLLAREPGRHSERLIQLQHGLVDLIDFLDPEATRFPKARRMKISLEPAPVTAPAP